MNRGLLLVAATTVAVLAAGGARAAEKVELKNVHMCCDGCADEVAAILGKVEGVSAVTTDKKATSAAFTATDAKTAQKALDALAAGGFHGDPGKDKGYAFKNDSGVKAGKVKSLTVTGFHNTCEGCVKSFRVAIQEVKGVTGDNVKAKVTTAEVTGEFDAAELVRALNKVGFHVRISPAYTVQSGGEMRNVMQKGNLDANVDCASLRETKGLYALGPVEGLKGEITIFDGNPAISTVKDGKPVVGEDWPKACFLVYAQVERWQTVELPKDVETLEHLQEFVQKSAKRAGIDTDKPFPFLVTGTPKRVKYHIVWKTDGQPHTKESHAKAKLPFEIIEREVQMVGFYSDKHHGVFTHHHDTNIHVHARTTDGKDAGHVDAVELVAGMTLHLPKP